MHIYQSTPYDKPAEHKKLKQGRVVKEDRNLTYSYPANRQKASVT